MSLFNYNNVTFPYCYLTQFNQEVVREESDTDWICTKFDIVLETVINLAYLASIAPDLAPGGTPIVRNAAAIMANIRTRLLQPRKTLSVKFNGVELIPKVQTGNPGTVDAQNGPKPQSCAIVQLTDNSFMVRYRVVANYWENPPDNPSDPNNPTNQPTGPILYNRWTETVDLDASQNSTRTREGKYGIRSDNAAGRLADSIRGSMAVVGVPEGFLRKSARYSVSPDGLVVNYSLVDQEQFKMPPKPAFEADGDFTLSSPTRGGALMYGEVNVKLKARKDIPQSQLLARAVAVASSKVLIAGGSIGTEQLPDFKGGVLESAAFRVALYRNEVEVRIKCFLGALRTRVGGIAGWQQRQVTRTPGSVNENYTPPYTGRGTASILLQAAAYYDPNFGAVVTPSTGQFNGNLLEPGQAGKTKET